jgi:hypothetical protein
MTLLFTVTNVESAPRVGLGIAAALTLAAGIVSAIRAKPRASKQLEVISSVCPDGTCHA